MDEYRPTRRRKLTPEEQKALEKQRRKEREIARKNAKQDAKYREAARKQAIKNGQNPHLVIEIPARPEPPKKKRRKKTTPDIIKAETNKRVRDMAPTDYDDGYYVDEVQVRKAQAQKQRRKRRKNQPKQLTPKQRKFRRIIAYICIILVIVVIGVSLSLTVLFKTENITVEGNKYYDNNTIIELVGVTKGDNIFVASMFGNEDAVSDKLPYVKEANIKFKIPDTVIIDITHETPYYAVKVTDGYYVVNEEGRILEKTETRPKKLMLIKVKSIKTAEIGKKMEFSDEKISQALNSISETILNYGYTDITEIDVRKLSNLSITYDNRIKVKIGMPQDIDYKLRTAFTIINEKLDPNNSGIIKGVLNVSECNTTKRSYFNEGEIDEIEATTVPTTEATTEATTALSTFVTAPADTQATESTEQVETEALE